MSEASDPDLLVLHAVRLQGMTTSQQAAGRFGLELGSAEDLLLDHEAYGWVSWSEFSGTGGWSLTERGRRENERRLAAELAAVPEGRPTLADLHEDFLPLNARLLQATTDWQIRPRPGQPLAVNDHRDRAWDERLLDELGDLATNLGPLVSRLTAVLTRFGGYDERFAAAHARAQDGDDTAVSGVGRDSCHAVWFELHEDLIATLGLTRSS